MTTGNHAKTFWMAATLLLAALPTTAQPRTTLSLLSPNEGEAPLAFETDSSNVIATRGGYMVTGSVDLKTPLGRIPLAGASLFFAFAEGTQTINTVHGTAYVPSPLQSGAVTIKKPAMAEFGMDTGDHLDLGIPLNPTRRYLYFRFDSGFEMEVGATGDDTDTRPLTLAIPAGASALLVLDPLDPFYYFSGAILTPRKDEEPKPDEPAQPPAEAEPTKEQDGGGQTGSGASSQSLIPFRPETTYGIDDLVHEFQGNKIQTGTFPVGTLPVQATGVMISDIHKLGSDEKAIDPLDIGFGPWARIGINGRFEFGFPFLKVKKLGNLAQFGFPLGTATAALELVDGHQQMYFSGVIEPDTSWLPDLCPIRPEARLRAYGNLSSDGTDFRLHADGRFAVDASAFGKLANVDLGNLIEVTGTLHIDRDGFLLEGLSDAALGVVGFEQQRHVELWIPFDESKTGYLQLDGLNRVSALSVRGKLRASAGKVEISGRLDSDAIDIAVAAQIAAADRGTMLSGTLSVPDQLQLGALGGVQESATAAKAQIASIYDDYQSATKDYELELSLRGMKTVLPPVCDQILSLLNSVQNTVYAQIDDRWPFLVPGKSSAKSSARSQIDNYRGRIRTLKSAVQSSNPEAVRAALRAALVDVLNHQVVTVKVKIVTYTYAYSRDVISSTVAGQIQTAVAAVDALPAASSRKVRAQQVWNAAPKREQLLAVADQIANGIAAVHIDALGFQQLVGEPQLTLLAQVTVAGSVQVVAIVFDPLNPLSIGKSIGVAVAGQL